MEKTRTSNRILPVIPTLVILCLNWNKKCKIKQTMLDAILHVKVGNTEKRWNFAAKWNDAAQKITPVVITYLPIRSNFGMVRKVVKISIFRFPGESACTENTRRSIECITKCLQNLQQKKKVFECIHAAAFCMLLGKSKAKFLK